MFGNSVNKKNGNLFISFYYSNVKDSKIILNLLEFRKMVLSSLYLCPQSICINNMLVLAGRWAGVIREIRGLGLGLPRSGLWPEHLTQGLVWGH